MSNEPTYHEPTFRTYPSEVVRGGDGRLRELTLCEDLVDGRWEPFYSERVIADA